MAALKSSLCSCAFGTCFKPFILRIQDPLQRKLLVPQVGRIRCTRASGRPFLAGC